MLNIRLVLNKRLNCLFLYQPEGISMAVPMKNGGMNPIRVVFYVILSGITTGVGAFFGGLIGSISQAIIALCLAFAAGAMIYVVSSELIPEAQAEKKSNLVTISVGVGFVIMMLLDVALG